MAWRDDLIEGRFRDAPFLIDRHSRSSGRRLAMHEYPLRDRPFAEDLGRSADGFSLELYVLGPDYFPARDLLEEALRREGPGTLRHPYLGTFRVSVRSYRVSESTREGGIARFSVEFVESGDRREPRATEDTSATVRSRADAAETAAVEDFADTFSTTGVPAFVGEEAIAVLEGAADAVGAAADTVPGLPRQAAAFRAALASFSNNLSDLILKPHELGTAVADLVADLEGVSRRPDEAASIYRDLDGHGDDAKPVARTTPARKQQADNQDAIHRLVRDTAAIGAARAASGQSWDTLDDAIAARDTLADRLDERAELAGDALYRTLADLRVAVIRDITARGADLARIGYYTPPQPAPALVIAHRVHGDATRDGEIVARNRVRHPGFVPGGDPLEVLLD